MDRYLILSKFKSSNPTVDIPPEVYQTRNIDVRKNRRVNALMIVFENDRFLKPYLRYIRSIMQYVKTKYETSTGLNFYKHWEQQTNLQFPNALIISRILKILFDDGIIINASITAGPVFYNTRYPEMTFGTVGPRSPVTYPL